MIMHLMTKLNYKINESFRRQKRKNRTMGWIVTINKILSLIDIHTSAVVSLTWNNLSGTGGHNK